MTFGAILMTYWTEYDFSKLILKTYKHYNHICYDDNVYTFDIETSSVFRYNEVIQGFNEDVRIHKDECEKYGFMYVWQFSINAEAVYGRTWKEFKDFLLLLSNFVPNRKIIYVHNLGFEFHHLLNVTIDWDVFARKARKPIKAYNSQYNIELRCSYFLTNTSLENLAKNMNLSIRKLTGNLDYGLIRTEKTSLTIEETAYCENDVLVLYEAIEKIKKEYKHVALIPLTQTGRVRQVVKKTYQRDTNYKSKISKMLPSTIEEFVMLNRAFTGGYTHANALHAGLINENVYNADLTSSYPSVMVAEKYPMTGFEKQESLELPDSNKYAYILEVTFTNIRNKVYNTFLSSHKSLDNHGMHIDVDNGRIIKAESVRYVLTDIDFMIALKAYDIESYSINSLWVARKEYLNTKFIKYILELYGYKTSLKGTSQEDLYMRSKEQINSLYGMTVTNTIRDDVLFNSGLWRENILSKQEIEDKLMEQKNSGKSFLNYAWGVWVTAYARRNLWSAILSINNDVIYCDTDSVYYFNDKKHAKYFTRYDETTLNKHKLAMEYHGLSYDLITPTDKYGTIRPLGIWEQGDKIDKFRTFGAKKYMYEIGDKRKITVSGVSKSKGIDQIGGIEDFKEGLLFDENHSGRITPSYNVNQPSFIVTDYLGNECEISQKYGINMLPNTYLLSYKPTIEDVYTALSLTSSSTSKVMEKLVEGKNETEIL